MCKDRDGLSLALPHQKARRRSAHTAHRPNKLTHFQPAFLPRCTVQHAHCHFGCRLPASGSQANGSRPESVHKPRSRTLRFMDRVRLGRVLGRGARLAARTAYEAIDAATAQAPVGTQPATPEILPPQTAGSTNRPLAKRTDAAHAFPQRKPSAPQTYSPSPAGRSARPGRLAPLRRASRAVSLEVTGSFFALFALSFAVGTWHAREDLHAGTPGVVRVAVFAAVTLFFAYCSVSNFQRAKRLG